MKNFGKILKFRANFFINISKFYKSLFDEFIWAECLLNRNFEDNVAVCLCVKCFWCYLSNQNSWACIQYIVYFIFVSCLLCPPPQFLYVADPMGPACTHACNLYELLDALGYCFEDFVSKPSTKSLVAVDRANHVVPVLFQ